ncbi:MAG: hypothetical protein AAF195_01960 [Pseudomonadota bacterium]
MPIPLRDYFYLKEVADYWKISTLDLEYMIENAYLTACFFLLDVEIEYGGYEKTPDGKCSLIPYEKSYCRGLYPLLPDDCRKIFRRGSTKISYFNFKNPNEYYKISKNNGLKIFREDLVITADEKNLFEKNMLFSQENKTSKVTALHDNIFFYHENNYHHVEYNNLVFEFGMIQAKIIEILHAASVTDQPWVHCKRLLDRAGSNSPRIRDLFKAKYGWRNMILSDGKGNYRLNV